MTDRSYDYGQHKISVYMYSNHGRLFLLYISLYKICVMSENRGLHFSVRLNKI